MAIIQIMMPRPLPPRLPRRDGEGMIIWMMAIWSAICKMTIQMVIHITIKIRICQMTIRIVIQMVIWQIRILMVMWMTIWMVILQMADQMAIIQIMMPSPALLGRGGGRGRGIIIWIMAIHMPICQMAVQMAIQMDIYKMTNQMVIQMDIWQTAIGGGRARMVTI